MVSKSAKNFSSMASVRSYLILSRGRVSVCSKWYVGKGVYPMSKTIKPKLDLLSKPQKRHEI